MKGGHMICTFTLYDDEEDLWECSNCRYLWRVDGYALDQKTMKYCQYCGNKIVSGLNI